MRGFLSQRVLLSAGLAAAVLLVLFPLLNCGFTTYDDADYVTANPHVRTSFTAENVLWAWTSFDHANWHPLTWMSLQLDASLYGMAPAGFHLTNLLLHTASTIVLFLALIELTRVTWPSAAVALLFGIHPLHVESVAWIAERKDVLAGLFFMLALLAYARGLNRNTVWPRATVTTLMACSLMAKPMAVTLPCVLVLLDFWPLFRWRQVLSRETWGCVREKWPLFLLSAVSSLVAVVAQSRGYAIQSRVVWSVPQRVLGAVSAYGVYLWQTIVPYPLVVLTPRQTRGWADPQVLAAAFALLVISTLVFWLRRSRPHLVAGWLWFLGMLVPVIGLVTIGEQAHANRYTYLPLVGLFVMVVWEAAALISKRPRFRLPIGLASLAIVAAFSLGARTQCRVWQNGETLWTRALEHTSPTVTSLFGLGSYYRNAGNPAKAIECFQAVLNQEPEYRLAQSNLGLCFAMEGRFVEAAGLFSPLLPIIPDDPEHAYRLGLSESRRERAGLALVFFTLALAQQPDHAVARLQFALQLERQGYHGPARVHLGEAVRLDPSFTQLPAVRDVFLSETDSTADRP